MFDIRVQSIIEGRANQFKIYRRIIRRDEEKALNQFRSMLDNTSGNTTCTST